jgi:hydroxymethylglutaryl-CoA lyase
MSGRPTSAASGSSIAVLAGSEVVHSLQVRRATLPRKIWSTCSTNQESWISLKLSKANDSRAGAALSAKQVHPSTEAKPPESSLLGVRPDMDPPPLLPRPANLPLRRLPKIHPQPPPQRQRPPHQHDHHAHQHLQFRQERQDNLQNHPHRGWQILLHGYGPRQIQLPRRPPPSASKVQFTRLTQLFDAIDTAPQVTIANLNGPAFGGGIGLGFACDVRFAVNTASVTLSEVKLGLYAATISKYVLREWGSAFAREAMLSARRIPVAELKALGVVAHVAGDLGELERDLERYVVDLAAAAPEASKMSKELVRLDFVDGGWKGQASGIERLFEEMMRSNGEAAWGLMQFQMGNKNVNWETRELGGCEGEVIGFSCSWINRCMSLVAVFRLSYSDCVMFATFPFLKPLGVPNPGSISG